MCLHNCNKENNKTSEDNTSERKDFLIFIELNMNINRLDFSVLSWS